MAAVEKWAHFCEGPLFPERAQIFEIFALKLEFRFQPVRVEASDDISITRFVELHAPLPGGTILSDALLWSPSQASFLREALVLDAAWAPVVDELNVKLHRAPAATGN